MVESSKAKSNNPIRNIIFTVVGILFIVIVWLLIRDGGTKNEADGSTNAKRIAYLSSFGWEVSESPVEVAEITIPGKFNDVYEKYNEIQRLQGFDLRRYQGKPAVKYTYKVLNYPEVSGKTFEPVLADLVLYDGRIIGGDVCAPELGGFMHGLKAQ